MSRWWSRRFSPTERKVLDCLTGPNTGRVVTHEELLKAINSNNPGFLRQVICRLRKKIEKDPALPDIIITHRGEGYSFMVGHTPIFIAKLTLDN